MSAFSFVAMMEGILTNEAYSSAFQLGEEYSRILTKLYHSIRAHCAESIHRRRKRLVDG